MGDPALVGEVEASIVELVAAGACALGSISTQVLVLAALGAQASFGGMVTVLLVLVTLVGATEDLAGVDGSLGTFTGAKTLVGLGSFTVESARSEACFAVAVAPPAAAPREEAAVVPLSLVMEIPALVGEADGSTVELEMAST